MATGNFQNQTRQLFTLVTCLCFLLLAFAFFSATPAHAQDNQIFALSDLIQQPGSITHEDKTFFGFTYSATGDMPTPDLVNVVTITDPSGNLGVSFQGLFGDLPGGGGSDALIRYSVSAPVDMPIIDAHLFGNPDVVGPPGITAGRVAVTETFVPDLPNVTLSIFHNEPGLRSNVDWEFFRNTPLTLLRVQKNIFAISENQDSTATLSFVDQTYSQLPEPSTVMLCLTGLLGFVLMNNRRRMGGRARS